MHRAGDGRGRQHGGSLPILLFPQLAASGWLLRTQTAFFHAAIASFILLGLDVWRMLQGQVSGAAAVPDRPHRLRLFRHDRDRGRPRPLYESSEELATQRGIDVANLEQVNRLIIQDMQDGVLVVDLNGVVRGHNAQVTRLLGGFGRMRGGMRLAEFSSTLHDYWRRWQEDYTEALPPFKVESTQRLLRVRLVRIGSGLNGGTLIYLEDLGRAQNEAQQMKLAALGRLTASIAHEVRNPLSAINQAAQLLEEDAIVPPAGARLLGMIRNNARRIDRIVGEVLQLNRRDRQQPEVVTLVEFMHSLIDEIMQAENMPPSAIVVLNPQRRPRDVRPRAFEPDRLEPRAQRLAALPEEGRQHSHRGAPGYMGDAIICELADDGPGIPAELRPQIFEPFFTTRPGGTGLGLYIARELADANGAALELLPGDPGAHFRMTMKRAFHPVVRQEVESHVQKIPRPAPSPPGRRRTRSARIAGAHAVAHGPRHHARRDRRRGHRVARCRAFDLCLTDMRLPDGEGLRVVEHINQKGLDLPVAVITAYGSAENAVAALKAGAFDYLAKPVALEQLRALVKQALKVPEKAQPPSALQPARRIAGDAAGARHDRAPREEPGAGVHQRRIRQRQGARRAHDPLGGTRARAAVHRRSTAAPSPRT